MDRIISKLLKEDFSVTSKLIHGRDNKLRVIRRESFEEKIVNILKEST